MFSVFSDKYRKKIFLSNVFYSYVDIGLETLREMGISRPFLYPVAVIFITFLI